MIIMTGTLLSNAQWNYINYPEGYSKENTVLINAFIIMAGTLFSSDMDVRATQIINAESQFEVYIPGNQNAIGIITRVSSNIGKTVVLILVKIS